MGTNRFYTHNSLGFWAGKQIQYQELWMEMAILNDDLMFEPVVASQLPDDFDKYSKEEKAKNREESPPLTLQ